MARGLMACLFSMRVAVGVCPKGPRNMYFSLLYIYISSMQDALWSWRTQNKNQGQFYVRFFESDLVSSPGFNSNQLFDFTIKEKEKKFKSETMPFTSKRKKKTYE